MNEERYKRIKDMVDRGYKLSERNAMMLIDEIERLRNDNIEILSTKEVNVVLPTMPESLVIDVLHKHVQSLQVQLSGYVNRRD